MIITASTSFQLLYLANCGLLIEYGGTRVLIDALCADDSPFDKVASETERFMLEGRAPFDHVDLLLFTHPHSDHFDAEKTRRFLAGHPESRLASFSAQTPFQLGALTIDFTPVDHITFPCQDHYCVKLSAGDSDLVFTADMDFSQLSQLGRRFELTGGPGPRRRILFFNPILLGKPQWLREVCSWNPERIFIYHIPAADIDEYSYRKMALHRLDRCEDVHPRPELLLEPMVPFTI